MLFFLCVFLVIRFQCLQIRRSYVLTAYLINEMINWSIDAATRMTYASVSAIIHKSNVDRDPSIFLLEASDCLGTDK
jgi:hypothetical protein